LYAAQVNGSDMNSSGVIDAGAVTTSGTKAWPPALSDSFSRYEPGTKRPSMGIVMVALHFARRIRVTGSTTAADWRLVRNAADLYTARPPLPPYQPIRHAVTVADRAVVETISRTVRPQETDVRFANASRPVFLVAVYVQAVVAARRFSRRTNPGEVGLAGHATAAARARVGVMPASTVRNGTSADIARVAVERAETRTTTPRDA
jgi:hypothetical protein